MDRNLIFALLFSVLAIGLFASPWYQNHFGHEVVVQESQPLTDISPTAGSSVVPRETTPSQAPAPVTSAPSQLSQVDAPQQERTIAIQNSLLRVSLSTRGGMITEASTLNYQGETKDQPAQLVSEGQYWYGGNITDGALVIPFQDLNFSVAEETPSSTTLTATMSDGKTITRTYVFTDNEYLIRTDTKLGGPWENPVITYTWLGPVKNTEVPVKALKIWPFSMFSTDNTYAFSKISYKGQGDRVSSTGGNEKTNRIYSTELQKVDAARSKTGGTDTFSGDITWYATRSKYFMCAAIPEDGVHWDAHATYQPVVQQKWYDFSISKPAGLGNTGLDLYIGPIAYSILRDTGHQLTDVMEFSWGFIRPLSIGFLWLLAWLKSFIPNWGLVILAFSLFIKAILYPLTWKSFISMRKMSLIQPQLLALKEKHKDNPQKLHLETMELYKREGVNPFSSCLPVLLQMPVFFALYPVIDRSFELRQAMFIPNWITDLSRPDPFFILPVAMGISMYFQMKPTMTDPSQKYTLYLMPFIMIILFANFSAGLTLYWLLFNIMSSVQQYYHKPAPA